MIKRFSNNLTLAKILRIFWQAKFPVRKVCLKCHHRRFSKLNDGRLKCKRCSFRFSLITDTYLANSRLLLDQWYELLWWFTYEFTANKTAKEVRLTQQRVHDCFSLIRKTIYDYEIREMIQFFGEIEVDETYIGTKFRNRRRERREYYRKLNVVKRGRGVKLLQQPIFGLYQRNGQVYVEFVQNVEKKTLQDIIKGKVILESDIYSDTFKSYKGLESRGYYHRTVDHGKEEYLKQISGKKVHINGIEGFWGYLKERLLKYHGIANRNLIYYIKEIEFRFNNRHLSTEEFIQKLIKILISEKLTSFERMVSKSNFSNKIKSIIFNQIYLEKSTQEILSFGPPKA